MKPWNFSRLNPNFSKLNNWVNQISLEKLDIAYNAAVAIKEIETKHFKSSSISSDVNKGKIINDYFRVQLQCELTNVKLNLSQFKLGSFAGRNCLAFWAAGKQNLYPYFHCNSTCDD